MVQDQWAKSACFHLLAINKIEKTVVLRRPQKNKILRNEFTSRDIVLAHPKL